MNKDQMIALRQKISNDVKPLVLEGLKGDPDGFDVIMRLIRSGDANEDLFNRAYESAKAIEDNEIKLNALMDLLDELDFEINKTNDISSTATGASIQPNNSDIANNANINNNQQSDEI